MHLFNRGYHLSQAIDWAWGTQQYPGQMKSFSTWSFESSRGNKQVTGKFYYSNECKHRDVRVQKKRPDQLGIGFLHLARSGWDKDGNTLPSRGNSHAKAQREREIQNTKVLSLVEKVTG